MDHGYRMDWNARLNDCVLNALLGNMSAKVPRQHSRLALCDMKTFVKQQLFV
jgi:hypothetical protein